MFQMRAEVHNELPKEAVDKYSGIFRITWNDLRRVWHTFQGNVAEDEGSSPRSGVDVA